MIEDERVRFDRAVAQGERALRGVRVLDGKVAFDLFQTHGSRSRSLSSFE